jgi:CheY-like chemotaxis protein
LIVEHEALIRGELRDRLEEWGYTVLEAVDADEAIQILNAHREIELLLTDIKMPGSMDGVRLAHHVRDRWPPVKIIVSSGSRDIQLSDLPQGASLLPKPYSPDCLAGVLAEVDGLGRRPRRSPIRDHR